MRDRLPVRRRTYRALSDLHAEFQRALAEPPAVSRRASTWWPAVVALEQVMDAVSAAAVAIDHGAPAPPAAAVAALAAALRGGAAAVRSGTRPSCLPVLPDAEGLRPVADAVRNVCHALCAAQARA